MCNCFLRCSVARCKQVSRLDRLFGLFLILPDRFTWINLSVSKYSVEESLGGENSNKCRWGKSGGSISHDSDIKSWSLTVVIELDLESTHSVDQIKLWHNFRIVLYSSRSQLVAITIKWVYPIWIPFVGIWSWVWNVDQVSSVLGSPWVEQSTEGVEWWSTTWRWWAFFFLKLKSLKPLSLVPICSVVDCDLIPWVINSSVREGSYFTWGVSLDLILIAEPIEEIKAWLNPGTSFVKPALIWSLYENANICLGN